MLGDSGDDDGEWLGEILPGWTLSCATTCCEESLSFGNFSVLAEEAKGSIVIVAVEEAGALCVAIADDDANDDAGDGAVTGLKIGPSGM